MLAALSVSGLKHLPSRSLGFVPGLTVIAGPVGAGKSMFLRDILFLLLAGKIPGKRTLASLGSDFQAAVSLRKGEQSLTVSRSGKSMSILEDSTTGASAVVEKVAQFTGVPSSRLAELCYCSGLTLPASVLTSGAILDLVRGAVGPGLNEYSKLFSPAMGKITAVKDQLIGQQSILNAGEGSSTLGSTLMRTNVELEALRLQAAQMEPGRVQCGEVLRCREAASVQEEIARIREQLGTMALLPSDQLDPLFSQLAEIRFSVKCWNAWQTQHGILWALGHRGELKELTSLVDLSHQYPELLKQDPNYLRQLHAKLQELSRMPVTSAENKQKAEIYLEACRKVHEQIAQLSATLRVTETTLKQREAAESAALDAEVRVRRLQRQLQQLEYLQQFLLPAGRYSVEKKVTELLFTQLLERASELMEASGLPGTLRYTAKEGLTLERPGVGVVSSDELSGGEVTLTALTLRLAVLEYLKWAPFLVLDDVTGPLGALTPAVCDMLRQWTRQTHVQTILITHDLTARADSLIYLQPAN